jgi:putative redox protein
MSEESIRVVNIERTSAGRYAASNARGGVLQIGAGEGDSFTPVELFLAAIGSCTAIDVDLITSRRADPSVFQVRVTGDKIRDEAGANRMQNLEVGFTVTFPEGEAGDAARAVLDRSVRMSHDRLCTVSLTVERGTPVAITVASASG